MHKVSVVIPNWNGKDMIGDCLRSLQKQTLKHQIIVVDNGSIDGSVEYIKSKFPDVVLVELAKNRGFTGGVNAGMRRALELGAEFIVLFNNDATAKNTWLENLTKAAEGHEDAGIVASKFMHTDKRTFDSTGEIFYSWGAPGPRGRGEIDRGQYDRGEYIFGASGGSSLYKTEMLKRIGLFDEDFFAYYEDADISFRAQLAGWKVYYEPGAVAYHRITGTSSRIHGLHAYNLAKNLPLVVWKNVPAKLLAPTLFRFGILYTVTLLGLLKQGKGWYGFKGFLVSLVYLPKKLFERRVIQKNRRVSDKYIRSLFASSLPPGTSKLRKVLQLFGISTV